MTKNILLAAVICGLLQAGCVSAIIESQKKIEPCAFKIDKPVVLSVKMSQPDDQIKRDIEGEWECKSPCFSYIKVDVNGQPFQYINGAKSFAVNTIKFNANGTLSYKISNNIINPQTQKVQNNSLQQDGSWSCQDGMLTLSLTNRELKQTFTVKAGIFWQDRDNALIGFDTGSFRQMTRSLHSSVQMPPGGKFENYNMYYDAAGNMYNVIRVSASNGGFNVVSEVITKQPPQIFKRIK